MLTVREKALVLVISVVIITAYPLKWVHENPLVTGYSSQNTTLNPVVVEVDGNALSSVLGNWSFIGKVHREYNGSYIEMIYSLNLRAIKTVDGSEALVDGLLGVEVLSKSGSVEVTRVTVDMLAGKNVWLGDLLPDYYTGFVYFKAAEGPYVVQPSCHGTNPNKEGCMEALLQKYNWGGGVVFYTWPDFSVKGDPPGLLR